MIDYSALIQIAADSAPQLRRCDVFRVVDAANECGELAAFCAWLTQERPELTEEIQACKDVTSSTTHRAPAGALEETRMAESFGMILERQATRQRLLDQAARLESDAISYERGTPYYSEPAPEYGEIPWPEDGRGSRLEGWHTPTADDMTHAAQLRARAARLRAQAES